MSTQINKIHDAVNGAINNKSIDKEVKESMCRAFGVPENLLAKCFSIFTLALVKSKTDDIVTDTPEDIKSYASSHRICSQEA